VPAMEIVIPEHGNDRYTEVARRRGKHPRLFGLTVCRQVARQQDEIGLALDGPERLGDSRACRLGGVHVPRCSDPDHD
jgi:hypothetical protein